MIETIILGIVQGIAEFLPISSSAHLIIVPWLFNWQDPGLGFDVALHWGTLLAVLLYFRTDVWLIIKGFFHSLRKNTRDLQNNIYQKLSWLLIIASVPGAIIGKLLEEQAQHAFRSPLLIAATLAIMGVVLFLADYFGSKQKNLDHVTWGNALIIGLSQAAALVPGVSRSGATMTAGLFLGFKRADAARFSFLMSLPITFGAGLAKLPQFHEGVTTAQLVTGIAVSAVCGYFAIKYLIQYLSNRSFVVFTVYRLLLAAVILSMYLIRR